MDKARREEARKRCEAATPGPWGWRSRGGNHSWMMEARDGTTIFDDGSSFGEYGPTTENEGPNVDFIAHARVDLPAALDALDDADKRIAGLEAERDALKAEVARLREAVDVRDEVAASGGGTLDHCAYCGARGKTHPLGAQPHAADCPKVTHPAGKETP